MEKGDPGMKLMLASPKALPRTPDINSPERVAELSDQQREPLQ
jgi:hypothetical protein